MKLSDAPHDARVSGWVESDLRDTVREYGGQIGIKTSPALRRLIILGLQAEGYEIESDVVPLSTLQKEIKT